MKSLDMDNNSPSNTDQGNYHREALQQLKQTGWDGQGLLRIKVTSESMAPLLRPGDYVLVKPVQPDDLARGDLVVVQRGGELVTHRLVGMGTGEWLTKGDRLYVFDPPLQKEAILGTVADVIRDGLVINLQTQRWRRINRSLGWLGWWEGCIYHYCAAFYHRVVYRGDNPPARLQPLASALAGLVTFPFRSLSRILLRGLRY
jgi:signal peptidase I